MATPQSYQKRFLSLGMVDSTPKNAGLNHLFSAAVVNQKFCRLLLHSPELALRQGYLGDAFDLSVEEKALILSIKAESLPDFAQQVTKSLSNSMIGSTPALRKTQI